MRPRHRAAENHVLAARMADGSTSFNEAAA